MIELSNLGVCNKVLLAQKVEILERGAKREATPSNCKSRIQMSKWSGKLSQCIV